MSQLLDHVSEMLENFYKLRVTGSDPLTLLLFALAAVATLLSLYLGWLCTKHNQMRQYRLAREREMAKNEKEKCPDGIINPEDILPGGAVDELGLDAAVDPVKFCDHIPGRVKRTQQRVAIQKVEEEMDENQREREREVQREQLHAIFKLVEDQKDKFGVDSEDQIEQQMRLYAQ